MRSLDYKTPDSAGTDAPTGLVIAPLVGAAAMLAAPVHSILEEPFGVFAVSDAVTQVGSPILAIGLWVDWLVLARRARLRVAVVLPTVVWAALHLWIAAWLGVGYFREPWND